MERQTERERERERENANFLMVFYPSQRTKLRGHSEKTQPPLLLNKEKTELREMPRVMLLLSVTHAVSAMACYTFKLTTGINGRLASKGLAVSSGTSLFT